MPRERLRRTSRSHLRFLIIGLAILAAGGLGGCASTPPPTPELVIPGYLQLNEDVAGLDLSPLQGRRIVIDPGHGGFFRGAVGVDGLTEAEVNLGVGLYLRGLLEWAGAEVWLTRTADYDFLAGTDSTLAADLAFRVSFTDSLQPDVFLSIHHNSNASLDRTINETQTYYRMNDDGASLDLAQAIHRHLVMNLEIEPARILPGNFHVLRNTTVPAVLGEPAMISNPVIEGRLSLAASQELEATAYFLGLLDYFATGTPRWTGADVDTVTVANLETPPEVSWFFNTGGPAVPDTTGLMTGPGPDPATFALELDGRPTRWKLSANGYGISWLPEPLTPGYHVLTVSGRNLAGRATPPRQTVLRPETTTAFTVELVYPGIQAKQPALALFHWRTLTPQPAAAGTWLTAGGRAEFENRRSEGWRLVDTATADRLAAGLTYQIETPDRHASSTAPLPVPVNVDTLIGTLSWHLLLAGHEAPPDATADLPDGWRDRMDLSLMNLARQDRTGPAVVLAPGMSVWIEAPGLLPMVDPHLGDAYAPRTIQADQPYLPVTPLAPDLQGKVVVLDPQTDGGKLRGPLGFRADDLNLACARWSARLLTGAGARVLLTRDGESELAPEQKIRLANEVGADFFLAIGRTPGDTTSVRHYPNSEAGRLWATSLTTAVSRLPGRQIAAPPAPGWDYLLRHTACPAVALDLLLPATAAEELLMAQPAWAQAEARAVLLSVLAAVAERFEPGPVCHVPDLLDALPPRSLGMSSDRRLDRVVLDGNYPWTPLSRQVAGAAAFPESRAAIDSGIDPGLPDRDRHTLEVHAGYHWQLWLLDREVTGWRAQLLLQNH